MKLTQGQVQLLTAVLALLALVLLPVSGALGSWPLLYAGLLSFVLAVLLWYVRNRCPHCRRHLGRNTGRYCPYCGEKL